MSKIVVQNDPASMPAHQPSPEEVRLQLHSILDSPAFQGSNRSRQFLQYVCEKSLAGQSGALKEKILAVDVFGRSPESALGEDTIVGVGAREVRKRLAQYYVLPEGAASKVRIDLPSGSYAPEFRYAAPEKQKEVDPPAAVPAVVPAAPPRKRLGLLALGAVLAIAVLTAIFTSGAWKTADPSAEAYSRFWRPVLDSREPLLLAVGHPLVYHPSSRAVKKSEERLPPMAVPQQRPLQLEPGEINGSDMIPVFNQYVGFGDMVVATQIASMLARNSKDVRVRLANTVQFADLRGSQALLIGALTNRWTMELGQSWRFQFHRRLEQGTFIVDTQSGPVKREWRSTPKDDGSVDKDFILVSRIVNSSTGGLLILAAGVKQFGTEAAGRLLTDPKQLGSILRKLPADWEGRNLQIILQTRVIGNTPAEPEPVAWHVW
ncbi:MAG TPA: hypothetical protein VEQ63_11165 [Bryobacteraceae bacterium]|nr:hypothetical protein [Bryobacteraceae bacterium]